MKLLSILLLVVLTGCALMPDNFALTLRSGDRTSIQGINATVGWNNPFKPRHVIEEYVSVEDGMEGGSLP